MVVLYHLRGYHHIYRMLLPESRHLYLSWVSQLIHMLLTCLLFSSVDLTRFSTVFQLIY